jgi:hypothetical protein
MTQLSLRSGWVVEDARTEGRTRRDETRPGQRRKTTTGRQSRSLTTAEKHEVKQIEKTGQMLMLQDGRGKRETLWSPSQSQLLLLRQLFPAVAALTGGQARTTAA